MPAFPLLDPVGPSPAEVETAILALAGERGAQRTLSPMEVARGLGGDHPDGWGPLMPQVRRAAVRLMKQGRIVILRKGRPVDADDFKGVYRIALAGAGETRDEGSSSSV